MEIKRGDLITMVVSGDGGKSCPALVIQADVFGALNSVTALRLTSNIHDWPLLRITIEPNKTNGLQKPSQVMIDKATTILREKIGQRIGHVDKSTMSLVEGALSKFLGLS